MSKWADSPVFRYDWAWCRHYIIMIHIWCILSLWIVTVMPTYCTVIPLYSAIVTIAAAIILILCLYPEFSDMSFLQHREWLDYDDCNNIIYIILYHWINRNFKSGKRPRGIWVSCIRAFFRICIRGGSCCTRARLHASVVRYSTHDLRNRI